MIKKLSKLRYWELAALGVSLIVVTNLLIMFAVRYLNGTWPQTTEAAHIAYVVISTAMAWVLSGIFVEAGFAKWREAKQATALDNLLDLIAGYDQEDAVFLEAQTEENKRG